VAGKTGTAQVVRLQEGVDSKDLAPHLQHHAWFVGWAPIDDPQIVIAVVVEHGGGGGSIAAPTASVILSAALGENNDPVTGQGQEG
jgi:penicillin-binding protein 2